MKIYKKLKNKKILLYNCNKNNNNKKIDLY